MLVKIKGIHKVRCKLADGSTKTYFYAWRGGPKMISQPHTEAFALEYARLKAAAAPKTVDTIETLIEQFKGPGRSPNPDWLALAETTRRDYEYAFRLILKEWPMMPLKFTQAGFKGQVRAWHRGFADNPRKADKLLFALSKLFSYAIAGDVVEKNPCEGITRLYSGSRKDAVWTPAQIDTFRANAPRHVLLPFEIAIHTAQRQGDILSMSWQQYDGSHLTIRQSKGGARVRVKAHYRLKELLDGLPRDTLRICTNSRGRPWTSDGFKSSWGKECARLGIEGVTFHDLRGTFITERRREGATSSQIALISGHSTSEVDAILDRHYMAFDQAASDAVIIRMERNTRRTEKVKRL